jgi:hypothetical protein
MHAAPSRLLLVLSLILLPILISGQPVRAQCQTFAGLTYATYVDKNGQGI